MEGRPCPKGSEGPEGPPPPRPRCLARWLRRSLAAVAPGPSPSSTPHLHATQLPHLVSPMQSLGAHQGRNAPQVWSTSRACRPQLRSPSSPEDTPEGLPVLKSPRAGRWAFHASHRCRPPTTRELLWLGGDPVRLEVGGCWMGPHGPRGEPRGVVGAAAGLGLSSPDTATSLPHHMVPRRSMGLGLLEAACAELGGWGWWERGFEGAPPHSP